MAGFRKPSAKKSFSARTTGRINRSVKRATNPFYGKKGTGFIKDPERSIKNSIYHKTTTGGFSSIKSSKTEQSDDLSADEWVKVILFFIVVFIVGGIYWSYFLLSKIKSARRRRKGCEVNEQQISHQSFII